MLKINKLNAKIDSKEILKEFSLNIKPGEVHAIMGPNGSGKSTLANVLSGKNGYDVSGDLKYQGEKSKLIIGDENIFATQFHPEKSGEAGLRFFDNFLKWNP